MIQNPGLEVRSNYIILPYIYKILYQFVSLEQQTCVKEGKPVYIITLWEHPH